MSKKLPVWYTSPTSTKKLISLVGLLKNSLYQILIDSYHYLEVDPIYTIKKDAVFNNERLINFDNINTGEVYAIVDSMNINLLKYLHYLNLDIDNGIFSYWIKINRDFKDNYTENITESMFTICTKIILEEINQNNIYEYVKKLWNLINSEFHKQYPASIPFPKKIKNINIKQLRKMYPTLKIDDALKQEVINSECILLFGDLDTYRKNHHLNYNVSIYDSQYSATLYIYQSTNQEIFEIASFCICPSQDQTRALITQNIGLVNLESNLKYFPIDNNFLIGNIYFSKLLFFVLNTMKLSEIVI